MVVAWFMGLSKTPAHGNHALTFLRRLYNWAHNMSSSTAPTPPSAFLCK